MEGGSRKKVFTIKDMEKAIREIISEEDLKPYRNLGNGLYELPGNIIANKKGLKEYLKEFKRKITV